MVAEARKALPIGDHHKATTQLLSMYKTVTHKVQPYTFCTPQQPSNTHQFLVRIGPDILLAYFTVL